MWNIKTKMIRVTIGATGTLSISFGKYLSDMTSRSYRKQTILGTVHILRKVLM
jgi:hypothetical protein